MTQGIVITTSETTEPFLNDLLESLPTMWPILLVCNDNHIPQVVRLAKLPPSTTVVCNDYNAWELGGVTKGAEHFDEFVHLMDTCIINKGIVDEKWPEAQLTPEMLFRIMFGGPGSCYLCRGFYSYLGKYRSDILRHVGIPRIETKEQAIHAEDNWNRVYLAADPSAWQFPALLPISSNVFEEKHGRRNMVLTNGYITKYKATWIG